VPGRTLKTDDGGQMADDSEGLVQALVNLTLLYEGHPRTTALSRFLSGRDYGFARPRKHWLL